MKGVLENVLENMCWKICGGKYVVENMWWKICAGKYVLENMCWKICAGKYVLENIDVKQVARHFYSFFLLFLPTR